MRHWFASGHFMNRLVQSLLGKLGQGFRNESAKEFDRPAN